ncbi:restriction endonuclease subunit R [Microbacterium sp.]|uniref:restriction endonuclease subunit R n=1 Tax=Microbacterium sp. TaxID=51671 RepID=UPI0039E37C2D
MTTPAPLPILPHGWTLAASAFNWTPDVIRAQRTAAEISADIVRSGVCGVIELEPGHLWRSFPAPDDAEVDALRAALDAAGGTVSMVGAAIDEWRPGGGRRDDDERLAFLLPQLRAAHRVGARGVRLPIGQAGPALLRRLQPILADLDLVLYEEIQGPQAPQTPHVAPALEVIAALDDPRVRVLVDISMLMPAVPVTYLDRLDAAGNVFPEDLRARLRDGWLDPETPDAVRAFLAAGRVPPELTALYMDLLVRFGRSHAASLRELMPLIGAFHLKFWDLDDADGRVSAPIRELGALLRDTGFTGTLCSEWGGHAWLDADASEMTRRHLALARAALSAR